jgi:hypothetical protein
VQLGRFVTVALIVVFTHVVASIILVLYTCVTVSNTTFVFVSYISLLRHVSAVHSHHQVHINFSKTVLLYTFFFYFCA